MELDNNRLSEDYVKTWKRLSKWFTEGGAEKALDKSDYEVALGNQVRVILKCVAREFGNRDCPVYLGRSIIYINSQVERKRIRLPITGDTYSRDAWNNWRDFVLEKDGRDLMFLDPSHPSHLLTELMWRLRPSIRWGQGYALALFVSDDQLFGLCQDLEEDVFPIKLCSRGGANFPDNRPASSHFRDLDRIAQAFGYRRKRYLLNSLLRQMNAQLDKVRKDAAISIDGYKQNDIVKLFNRPLRTLYELQYHAETPPNNIFYLTDLVDSEYVGAVDLEILYNGSTQSSDVIKFLKQFEWAISHYVIQLVAGAEHNFSLSGETYKNNFFCDDGLKKTIEVVNKCYQKNEDKVKVKQVFKILSDHFEIAESVRGRFWKGYPRQAFEVACCVADIVEHIFHDSDPSASIIRQSNFGREIRSCGPSLKKLDEIINQEHSFIGQLFKGLQAERELFLVPNYREHFIHAFHVFVFGLWLLSEKPSKIFPPTFLDLNIKTVRAWFIVSMWHDIAYSLQKLSQIAENSARRLVGESLVKRHTGLIPLRPSLGHLMQQVDHLSSIFEEIKTFANNIFYLPHSYIEPIDIITAMALDNIDHGVWSGLLLGNALNSVSDPASINNCFGSFTKDDLVSAIIPHHISSWDFEELFKQFGKWDDKNGKYVETDNDNVQGIKIDRNRNKLGFLLALADMLSQAGREALDMGGILPSDIGIRLMSIGIDKKERPKKILRVSYQYIKSKQPAKDILEKYFKPPANFLGLNFDTNVGEHHSGMILVTVKRYRGGDHTASLEWKGIT